MTRMKHENIIGSLVEDHAGDGGLQHQHRHGHRHSYQASALHLLFCISVIRGMNISIHESQH